MANFLLNTLIALRCRIIDHDHGIQISLLMRNRKAPEETIKLNNGAWLGCHIVLLKGVVIGDEDVVAASAVVTKSILPNQFWPSVPARKIGQQGT